MSLEIKMLYDMVKEILESDKDLFKEELEKLNSLTNINKDVLFSLIDGNGDIETTTLDKVEILSLNEPLDNRVSIKM